MQWCGGVTVILKLIVPHVAVSDSHFDADYNHIYSVIFLLFIHNVRVSVNREVQSAATCCKETPVAVGSGVRWRCAPAASASVCQEAARVHVSPGATHPRPPGRRAAPSARPPPEPPAGPGGRLGGENKKFRNEVWYCHYPSTVLNLASHVPYSM